MLINEEQKHHKKHIKNICSSIHLLLLIWSRVCIFWVEQRSPYFTFWPALPRGSLGASSVSWASLGPVKPWSLSWEVSLEMPEPPHLASLEVGWDSWSGRTPQGKQVLGGPLCMDPMMSKKNGLSRSDTGYWGPPWHGGGWVCTHGASAGHKDLGGLF